MGSRAAVGLDVAVGIGNDVGMVLVLVLVLMLVSVLLLVLMLALGKQSSSWWKEEPGVAGLSHLSSVTLWSPGSFVSPSPPCHLRQPPSTLRSRAKPPPTSDNHPSPRNPLDLQREIGFMWRS